MGLQLLIGLIGIGIGLRRAHGRPLAGARAATAALTLAAGLLAACGGGAEDGSRLRPPPVVSELQVEPPYPWIDRRVDFRATCQGRAPFTFDWDFGDGTRASAAAAELSHAYRAPGRYTLSVTCQDANGRSLTDMRTVRVYPRDLASVADSACYSDYMGHGWCRQTPRLTGPIYSRTVGAEAEVLWGIGRYGNVRRTVNLNQIFWLEQVSALAVSLPRRAWAATEDTVRYTWAADTAEWDSSVVWQYPRSAPVGPVTHLQAAGDDVVWALGGGAGSVVQRTLDGGLTWAATAAQPAGDGALRTLFARDAQRAWVLGSDGQLQRTTDGGSTWEPVAIPVGVPSPTGQGAIDLAGLNPQRSVAWLVRAPNEVLVLRLDSGQWEQVGSPPGGGTITSVSAFGDETAWFAGTTDGSPSRGLLLRVDGSGTQRRWRSFTVPASEHRLLSVTAYARDAAWAAGEHLLLNVTQTSTTIVSESIGATDENLVGFSAVDDRVAWALGESGSIVTTDNGGSQWVRGLSTAPGGSRSLLAFDMAKAWAIDGDGVLQATDDGGLNWRASSDTQSVGLLALMRGGTEGHWLVGRQGRVMLGNDDRRFAPVACSLPATLDFGAGAARDSRTAWLLARPSTLDDTNWTALWQIEEGGRTCRSVPLEGVNALHAVAMADDNEIWVAGNEGPDPGTTVVWRSTDAGRTWQRHALPWIADAMALAAWPGSGAWLVSSEVVWRLVPDGDQLHWYAQLWLEPDEQPMWQLQVFDGQTLWGAGAAGQIWRTMTAGDVVPP